MSSEFSDAELDQCLDELNKSLDSVPEKDIKLAPDFIASTVSRLLNVKKSVLLKRGPKFTRAMGLLAAQMASNIKERQFHIVEDVLYFMPKLKGSITIEPNEKELAEREQLWKELVPGQHIDALKVEQLRESKLTGWVPAVVKERDPKKGVFVEFRESDTVWLESSKSIAPSERYTKDWDWRYMIQAKDGVDACDDFGHWYQSTVFSTKMKLKGGPSCELGLDKVLIGYRYFTPNGTKRDPQGNLYEGWSSMYDEWIPATSLRLQRPASVCKEGVVYCKNQLDRSADEAVNAADIMQNNDQLDVQCALERADYESPHVIVVLLDQLCKVGAFQELTKQLSLANQDRLREIKARDLIGMIKGIGCIAPLLHKRCVVKEIKGFYSAIMDIVTEKMNAKLSTDEIKMFVGVSFMLSRLTAQIYTQRTKQEKMEQFLVLLTKACFEQPEESLNVLGEELVEKLCFYKEFPFRSQHQTYMWLNESVGDKEVFWTKLADNFMYGFDYSCMTFIHLIGAGAGNNIKKWLYKIDRNTIISVITRMKDILPKNVVSLQVSMLTKIIGFYKNDKELCNIATRLLWSFTNSCQGYSKSIAEESKQFLVSRNDARKDILEWALEDLRKLKTEGPQTEYMNVTRALRYFNDAISVRYGRRPAGPAKEPLVVEAMSGGVFETILRNFELYYARFRKTNVLPEGLLVTLEHKRLTYKCSQIHLREVATFIEFFRNYVMLSESGLSADLLKRIWDLLVTGSVLEDDAIQFYTIFGELIMSCGYAGAEPQVGKRKVLESFFVTEMSLFPHKISELPLDTLSNYLRAVLLLSRDQKMLLNLSYDSSDKFSFIPCKPVESYVGIQFFFNFLKDPKPSEQVFDVLQILAKLYSLTHQTQELGSLALNVIDRIDYMVRKGFSAGRYMLLAAAFDTLEYIINTSELLGGYLPSFYELSKHAAPMRFKVVVGSGLNDISVYPNALLRVLIRKICKMTGHKYCNVEVNDDGVLLSDTKKLSQPIADILRDYQLQKLQPKRLDRLLIDGKLAPEVLKLVEEVFGHFSVQNKMYPSNLASLLTAATAAAEPFGEAYVKNIFNIYGASGADYLDKAQFVKFYEDMAKGMPEVAIGELRALGVDTTSLNDCDVPFPADCETLPRYWISNGPSFVKLTELYKQMKTKAESKRMNQLLDSLVANQELVERIISNAEPVPKVVPYLLKCVHSLLLEKAEKVSPDPEMQERIREWWWNLPNSLCSSAYFIDAIFLANKDLFSDDICEDAYKVFSWLCKDVLLSLRADQEKKIAYLKLQRLGPDTPVEIQGRIKKLFSYVKLKTPDIVTSFYTVRSKYPKKIARLAECLKPAAHALLTMYTSVPVLKKLLEMIEYWKAHQVPGPIVHLLRVIEYEMLVCPEGMGSALDSVPELVTTLMSLCSNSNGLLAQKSGDIILLILQVLTPYSKNFPPTKLLQLILTALHSDNLKAMSSLHIYLLQLICAAIDYCGEDDVRQIPFRDEIKYLSSLVHNSNDTSFTDVRFMYSFAIYKLTDYYVWFKGADLVTEKGKDIKNSIDFVKIIMVVKEEIEALLMSNFTTVPTYSEYINMLMMTIYDRMKLPLDGVMADIENLVVNVIPAQTPASAEAIEKQISELYSLTKEKDVFLDKYWIQLSQRIGQQKYLSLDVDRKLVEMMKKVCYTNVLRRITHLLQDYETSRVLVEQFVQSQHDLTRAPPVKEIDMNIKIFSVANWPASLEVPLVYPSELHKLKHEYEVFYLRNFRDRRLTWLHSQSTVDVVTTYLPKTYYFTLTLYQYAILSLFETFKEITYEEARTKLEMKKQVLDQNLRGLMSSTVANSVILKQNHKTPQCEDKERLQLNPGFVSTHLKRSFVPQAAKPETKKAQVSEAAFEGERIAKERMYVIESFIMKIMKGKKRESHNVLVVEVMKCVKEFPVDAPLIKERIESLIERDYLTRDPDDRSIYIYVPQSAGASMDIATNHSPQDQRTIMDE